MRKLLNRKIAEQVGKCAICPKEFSDYNDIVPDHRHPKRMGGARRDDQARQGHAWQQNESNKAADLNLWKASWPAPETR